MSEACTDRITMSVVFASLETISLVHVEMFWLVHVTYVLSIHLTKIFD